MEHRLSPRTTTPIAVVVHVRGRGRARCVTRDASVDGMFINLDAGLFGVRERSVIEVTLAEAGGGTPHAATMAYVVHRQRHGLGVMFTSLASPMRDAIARLLAERRVSEARGAPPPTRPP